MRAFGIAFFVYLIIAVAALVVRPNNALPVFLDFAAVIIAVVLLLMVPFSREFRSFSPWFRAVNVLFAVTFLVWSALGLILTFRSLDFSAHLRGALFRGKLMLGGMSMGFFVSLALSRLFEARGLTKR